MARGRVLVPYAAPILVVLIAIATGMSRGLGLALLVLAGGMLLLAITLAWNSVQSLGDDRELTLDEALALAAPSVEEEKKRAVLRALKDLEFERSVGKISEEDYAKLSQRYREEAKQLLRSLDRSDSPGRERAERLVKKRLEKAGLSPVTEVAAARAPSERPPPEAGPNERDSESEPPDEPAPNGPFDADPGAEQTVSNDVPSDEETKTCSECETVNDKDARFCKHCGTLLG